MSALVTLLALTGFAALLLRALRFALRVALHTAEVTAASGLAEVSQRRGDLTALAERRAAAARARRSRGRDALRLAAWTVWLVIPAFTDVSREAYALAAPLWLLPTPPVREGGGGGGEPVHR